MTLGPTAAERALLRFVLPGWPFALRYGAAFAAFAFGGAMVLDVVPGGIVLGVAVILVGHLLLWVRTQTLAPGGATPASDDEAWVPVDPDWLDRVRALEDAGRRWDVSTWDISNAAGCVSLAALLGLVVLTAAVLRVPHLEIAGAAYLLPVWLSGIRTTWNPSELRIKGEVLEIAAATASREAGDRFDVVPLCVMREGSRGRYPTDARLMLRPTRGHEELLGVQVQVAINSVQGKDYPYLYGVVLVREGGRLPSARDEGPDVVERGAGEGVRYLVVRQHADNSGGWHTEPADVERLVTHALRLAARCA